MTRASDLVGKTIKTEIGNLVITRAKFCGMTTGEDLTITKYVEIECKCGANFMSEINQLESTIVQ